jgi:hypothetical protein
MKKLLPLFLLASIQIRSQSVSLSQAAYQPVVGDTSRHYVLDTSWYGGGLNAALTGSNILWEYSHIVTTTAVVTSAYVDPTSVPSASDYPGCTGGAKNGTVKHLL